VDSDDLQSGLVSRDVEKNLEFAIRYGTAFDVDQCFSQLKSARARIMRSKKLPEEEVAKLFLAFRRYVSWLERQFPRFALDRCPCCGSKLLSRRCLGCDMKRSAP